MNTANPSRSQTMRTLLPGAILFVLLSQMAAGQLAVGEPMPGLSLSGIDGSAITVAVTDRSLIVRRGDKDERPKVFVVHFLQPDCPQCRAQLKPEDVLHREYSSRGVSVLGVAYRGKPEDAKALRQDLGLELPLAVASPDSGIDQLAAGDAFGIADASGTVRFFQAGFGEGDQVRWREVVDALLAGRPSPHETVARERLKPGDGFPSVTLPSLRTGKAISLRGDKDGLRFTGEDGSTTKPRAVLFFFSRY